MASASSAGGRPVDRERHHHHRRRSPARRRSRAPPRRRCARPGSAGPAVRAISASMSRSYHMLMAPDGAGADRDAQHGDGREHRMEVPRRHQQADEAGEHHQRHHPRLQQREEVADRARRMPAPRRPRRRRGGVASNRRLGPRPALPRSAVIDGRVGLITRQLLEGVERRRRGHASIPASWRPRPRSCRPTLLARR